MIPKFIFTFIVMILIQFIIVSCGKNDPPVTCHCDQTEKGNLATYETSAEDCKACAEMNKTYTEYDPFTNQNYTVTINCYCK